MQKHLQSMSEKFLQVAAILDGIAEELRDLGGSTGPLKLPGKTGAPHPPATHSRAVQALLEKTDYTYNDVGVLVGVPVSYTHLTLPTINSV